MILYIILFIALFAGFFVWRYQSSLREITLKIAGEDISASIYSKGKDSKPIKSFSGNEKTVKLKSGDYYAVINGKNVEKYKQAFTVKEQGYTINIQPDFSSNFLSEILKQERPAIITAIRNAYPKLIDTYTIAEETLFKKGEWYGATISKNINPRDVTDTYRIVMYKESGVWKIIHYPEIILTTARFPNVPLEILTRINDL